MLPSGFAIVAGSAVFNGAVALMLASMLGAGLVLVWGAVGFTFGAVVGVVAVLRPRGDEGHRRPGGQGEGRPGRRLTASWRRSVRRLRRGIRPPRRRPGRRRAAGPGASD